jgi:hypothetical protein
MSYTINLTDGALLTIIPDGTINTTSSSLTLVGKNYAGYGQFLDTNFVHLLENASNTTAPGVPLTGQLWWNSGTGILNVYNGTAWKRISGATSSTTAPSGSISVAGDLWYDSVNAQLNIYTGSSWLLVGPQSSAGQGTTGSIPTTITDNTSQNHVVLELWTANTIVGMVSKDSTFTPGTAVPGGWGIQPISPGITLSTNVANSAFQGTSIKALYADVAERFSADQVYESGTVVELGGVAEITRSDTELSENVFGVISTQAAYLMNSGAGTDATHPPVAMTGRVPVRAVGMVCKGDRLVSAGNGVARSAVAGEATAFNVIGRALKDKSDTGVGTVEAIVTIK